MSEESISLHDLLNVSIGTPQAGAVNFSALHALLHAVLQQLDLQRVEVRWGGGGAAGDRPAEDNDDGEKGEQEVGPGARGREAPSPPASSEQTSLLPRVQSCESDLSKALDLLQHLQDRSDGLKEEVEQLRLQREAAEAQARTQAQTQTQAQAEAVSAAEACCLRVDALEETVRSLSGRVQRFPEPERPDLVTWEDVESVLLGEDLQEQERLDSGAVDRPHQGNAAARQMAPPRGSSPPAVTSGQTPTPQETTSEPRQQDGADRDPTAAAGGGWRRYPEAAEALRDIGKLREKFSQLQARVVELEEGRGEEPPHVTELTTDREFQDSSNDLMDELTQQKTFLENLSGDQEKLVKEVQTALLQLRDECEKLHQSNRSLQEENREKRSRIQELLKTMEELEEKKADKETMEREMTKVTHLQLGSEQLGATLKDLLEKVSFQEQDWHRVIDGLSSQIDQKLNRIELDSVKKQLESRWRNISEKLRAQEGLEADDAAALRKQLVDRFNCLSCDRPIVKYGHAQHFVKLPSSPGFPAHRSIRPFTVYALEQFRQHDRSERIPGLADYGHVTVTRNCGGSHTVNSAGQRRQSSRHHGLAEVDLAVQSEEVDIVGLDGHVYKGRLSAPPVRTAEIRLPTIPAKDGCKPTPRKPATSPEAAALHRPPSAGSRSASSSSGRDWPVSALGCSSQASDAAAAAGVSTQAGEPPDL